MNLTPRYIRLKDAYQYSAMGKDLFASEIRPLLTVYRWGHRGIAFDITELDAVLANYANERVKGKRKKCSPDSKNVVNIGTLKRHSKGESSLAQLAKLKERVRKKSS